MLTHKASGNLSATDQLLAPAASDNNYLITVTKPAAAELQLPNGLSYNYQR